MSSNTLRSTSTGTCRPMATAPISAPTSATARRPSAISARSRRPPTGSASRACCCRPERAARMLGSSQPALIPLTERLRFLVALRPGSGTPALFARHAATLDRISGGRVLLNVVTGARPGRPRRRRQQAQSHDERYAQTDEFLTIWRRILSGEPADFEGKYLSAHGTDISFPPVQQPHPPLWFGGSSDAGIAIAAKHVDVYLSWGEPVDQLAEKIDRVRARPPRKAARSALACASI